MGILDYLFIFLILFQFAALWTLFNRLSAFILATEKSIALTRELIESLYSTAHDHSQRLNLVNEKLTTMHNSSIPSIQMPAMSKEEQFQKKYAGLANGLSRRRGE